MLEVPEPEVSESEVQELEVMEVLEPEVSEVYLGEGAHELPQGTRRELVSVSQQRLSLFWNPSGEKNAWKNKRSLNKDLCKAEKAEAWMNPLSQTHGKHGANLVEIVLELGL